MNRFIKIFAQAFILLSMFAFFSVAAMAFWSPQAVMDLVSVQLNNTDAFSSIRGVYGGVGLTICMSLGYLLRKNPSQALFFLAVLWGLYAISRIMTIWIEGYLGAFGRQWLLIESLFCIIACVLWISYEKKVKHIAL